MRLEKLICPILECSNELSTMKTKKKNILLFLLVMGSGCDICYNNVQEFKKKRYYFVLNTKEIEQVRYKTFKGVNLNGKQEVLQEVGFDDLFKVAQPGDTIIKEKGSADVKLKQGNRELIFHCYCNGELVE